MILSKIITSFNNAFRTTGTTMIDIQQKKLAIVTAGHLENLTIELLKCIEKSKCDKIGSFSSNLLSLLFLLINLVEKY